jgi:hypothetical protein
MSNSWPFVTNDCPYCKTTMDPKLVLREDPEVLIETVEVLAAAWAEAIEGSATSRH